MQTESAPPAYFDADHRSVDELAALIDTTTHLGDYPHAADIVREVVVYDGTTFDEAADDPVHRRELMAELADLLRDGPGVLLVRNAVPRAVAEHAAEVLHGLFAEQRSVERLATGDHFGLPGINERLWNALEKLAVASPSCFADYYSSTTIATVSEAWLGPGYQITSQINLVNPGGTAQSPHRDYHLGFMSDDSAAVYPVHVHHMSPMLTLQGAVAHIDMTVESGPTKVLPHSHKYPPGYVVWKQPEVIELFERRCVQLPLAAGDAVFFNPAVYHGAGSNVTADVRRMANLLQISSAFGRATEAVDRGRVSRAVYPELLARQEAAWPEGAIARTVAAAAEGYAFPTNLDRDPPVGGLAPPAQAEVVRRALAERWSSDALDTALTAHADRRLTW